MKSSRMHKNGSFKSTSPLGKAGRAYQTNESMMIVGASVLAVPCVESDLRTDGWGVCCCGSALTFVLYGNGRTLTVDTFADGQTLIVHTLANPCCLFLKFPQTTKTASK